MNRRVLLVVALGTVLPGAAQADQASAPTSSAAAGLDSGDAHTCAVVLDGRVRCWGFNANGQLGYANEATVGDDEAPGSVGPVDVGDGRRTRALGVGAFHTCALLDDATVRCWGSGIAGQLGRFQSLSDVGDNETPGSVPPVDLGDGRTARAVSAGSGHNCALLDDGNVRCWGLGYQGRLGYGSHDSVGIDESPGSVGPVFLGAGRTATAISAGADHTCAVLDNGQVRCWGDGSHGQLGYGSVEDVGDDETPGMVPPVDLGDGNTAVAISAGGEHSCAVLENGSVRCWGNGAEGRLGYGNTSAIGDDETPGIVGPVDLGQGRSAAAIAAGPEHTCALLDNGSVRCWGPNLAGQLGSGVAATIGDNEAPGSAAPVDLGAGRSALAIGLGALHTCARLDDGSVRCWGSGENGRLGNCSRAIIGDDDAPSATGPVALTSTLGGGCGGGSRSPAAIVTPPGGPGPTASGSDGVRSQAARLRALRGCRSRAGRHARREARRARRLAGPARERALRHARRHENRLRRACLRRHGRTPGRVTQLRARADSSRKVVLTFGAAGTDRDRPPAARVYVIKQSRTPIRSARGFRRAAALCDGSCRFSSITSVGARLTVTVTDLRPGTTYYYAIAARDNVSRRLGRRSNTVSVRTSR